MIDAVRCAKLALDRGLGGAIVGPSSYFMKSPPQQFPDHVAREMTLQFIADGHSDRSATNLDHAVRARTSRDVRANG